MKRRGFTLIELLAVIVVLAIIALIATQMVLNTIEEARKGSANSSAHSYISEAETKLASYMLKNGGSGYIAGIHNVETLKTDLGIALKGAVPTEGKICIGNDGIIKNASLKINGYVVSYDGKNMTTTDLEEIENIECNYTAPILEKAKTLVYDEDGICKTDGTTYNYMGGCYIKGASTNNYVWYNGFMWRIMGINSDGTVRMITDENVTALAYGAGSDALTYTTNEGYIHDWLNEYFYSNLNSAKSIIQNGTYFCSESTDEATLTEGRTTCAEENLVETKVGLMSLDEYLLAGSSSSYLHIGQMSWTMTPFNTDYAWYLNYNSHSNRNIVVSSPNGLRPVINVDSSISITSGDGTTQNFYILGEAKSTSTTGSLSETVTSGEYVNLEGHTYRVVRKANDGVKLILDGFYEEKQGTIYTMKYNETTGDNVFVLTSGIGAKLNGDVITWLKLNNSNKIVETTYYQGNGIAFGATYQNALNKSNGIEAKVGLIQIGDILAGQSSTVLTKNYTVSRGTNNTTAYWTMNKYASSNTNIWYIYSSSGTHNLGVTNASGVRPVITVRNDLNITSGNGTWKSPYQI